MMRVEPKLTGEREERRYIACRAHHSRERSTRVLTNSRARRIIREIALPDIRTEIRLLG